MKNKINQIANSCSIRPFTSADIPKLLELLRLHTPRYFHPSEEKDFTFYLNNHTEAYLIAEVDQQIIGAGGINYFPDIKVARLSWDIIHPDFLGQGIGTELINYRLNLLGQNPAITLVEVRTTQLVYKFYQKQGFTLAKTENDFWAPGFDLYQMQLDLNRKAGSAKEGL